LALVGFDAGADELITGCVAKAVLVFSALHAASRSGVAKKFPAIGVFEAADTLAKLNLTSTPFGAISI
jgi:hypothetical protein